MSSINPTRSIATALAPSYALNVPNVGSRLPRLTSPAPPPPDFGSLIKYLNDPDQFPNIFKDWINIPNGGRPGVGGGVVDGGKTGAPYQPPAPVPANPPNTDPASQEPKYNGNDVPDPGDWMPNPDSGDPGGPRTNWGAALNALPQLSPALIAGKLALR